jgi:hypothetical protein
VSGETAFGLLILLAPWLGPLLLLVIIGGVLGGISWVMDRFWDLVVRERRDPKP